MLRIHYIVCLIVGLVCLVAGSGLLASRDVATVPLEEVQWQQVLQQCQGGVPQAGDFESPLKDDSSRERHPFQRCERARQFFTVFQLVILTLLGLLSLSNEGLPPTKPSRDQLREILSKAGRARIFQKS